MLDEKIAESIGSMNSEDLVDTLRLAGQKLAVLIDEGEIIKADSRTIYSLPLFAVDNLIDSGDLIGIEETRKTLKFGSQQAVMSSVRSKRTPLDAVQVGRNWFFTVSWMRSYEKRRYTGRTRKTAKKS